MSEKINRPPWIKVIEGGKEKKEVPVVQDEQTREAEVAGIDEDSNTEVSKEYSDAMKALFLDFVANGGDKESVSGNENNIERSANAYRDILRMYTVQQLETLRDNPILKTTKPALHRAVVTEIKRRLLDDTQE